MPKDYLAMRKAEPKDAKQYGVKGMKWGVRRRSGELKEAAKQRQATATIKKPDAKADSGEPPVAESSATRYARIQQQAKAGGGTQLSDADLKFFNARTEALSKIAKLNEEKPGWLAETTKDVLQKTAKRQLQSISDAVADKYVGAPLKGALVGAAAAKAAADKKSSSDDSDD